MPAFAGRTHFITNRPQTSELPIKRSLTAGGERSEDRSPFEPMRRSLPRSRLGLFQKFGVVFGRKYLRLLKKRGHLFVVQFGRSCGASRHGDADFQEEFLLSCGGADADQTGGVCRRVVELMRSIGRNVDC